MMMKIVIIMMVRCRKCVIGFLLSLPSLLTQQVAITAMCIMHLPLPHLCVGSADASVTVYDLATQVRDIAIIIIIVMLMILIIIVQDVCGRIVSLADVPTALECFTVTRKVSYSHETIAHLLIGDSTGSMHIVTLDSEFGQTSDAGAKKKNQLLFSQAIEVMCAVYVLHWCITCRDTVAL